MKQQRTEDAIVTPATIEVFTGFAASLKRIHVRLVMEGYTITEGKIYKLGETVPPDVKKKQS